MIILLQLLSNDLQLTPGISGNTEDPRIPSGRWMTSLDEKGTSGGYRGGGRDPPCWRRAALLRNVGCGTDKQTNSQVRQIGGETHRKSRQPHYGLQVENLGR